MEAVFLDAFGDEFGNARLKKWHLTLFEFGNPARVRIHTGDVHAKFCEAGPGD